MRTTLPVRRRSAALLAVAALAVAVGLFAVIHRLGTDEPAGIRATSAQYQVELQLGEDRTGVIDADLLIHDAEGEPVDPQTVTVESAMPSMGHATAEVTATRADAGRYRLHGELFPMTGAWELTIRITGTAGPDEITLPVTVTR
ncbi:YtkA-like protein [Kribbella amoyensis]|uniref:YtkA-like protein n=1 Tax=Kribbella amoyensis TaxID=996641 RepID=A0A561BYI6_9ACTN|nr:FixH family protein [Kribbella amoyensis]TWD83965.1 YtkA-like protein [Kribbella amoyensis]